MSQSKRNTIYSKEYRDLASKLKRIRKLAGLTQTEAARKLGRPQSYISKIESAQYYLDIFELKALAQIYKVDTSYFYR